MDLIIIILVSLGFSALFSGTEIAFVSINRLRIELKSKKGLDTAKIISGFLESPASFISAMLVGNNIALVVYGSAMAKLLDPFIEAWLLRIEMSYDLLQLLIQTLISTFVVLIFGEFLPKSLFRVHPHRILSFFAVPLKYFYEFVRYAFLWFINIIAALFLKWVFKIELKDNPADFSKFDLYHLIAESNTMSSEEEPDVDINYFQKALFLTEVKVRECLVPRTELVAIEINEPITKLRDLVLSSEHSKILVYKENIDNIVGFVHFSDLLGLPAKIESVTKEILIVPESMPSMEVLRKFIAEQKSIALVLDEYGGTAGIVSMEDVMEEIFGEIEDEHDTEDLIEVQLGSNEFIFSARHEIDYINERFNLKLPQGDFETLGGMIYSEQQSIPEVGEIISLDDDRLEVKILSASNNRIEKVKITISEKPLDD